jgi:hypothetical protein
MIKAVLIAIPIALTVATGSAVASDASSAKGIACSATTAQKMEFRAAADAASEKSSPCVEVSGYLYLNAFYASKEAALDQKQEPDWQMMGLIREPGADEQESLKEPIHYSVLGTLEDCGSSNTPSYCHYVGGAVIRVVAMKRR